MDTNISGVGDGMASSGQPQIINIRKNLVQAFGLIQLFLQHWMFLDTVLWSICALAIIHSII